VAVAFRQMLVWFGLQQLASILWRMSADAQRAGHESLLRGLIALAMAGAALAATVMLVIWVYRLAASMGFKAPWAWMIAMLWPCVNLLFLLLINRKASAWCKQRGVLVGFLGPSEATIEQLRRQAIASSLPPPAQPPPPAP